MWGYHARLVRDLASKSRAMNDNQKIAKNPPSCKRQSVSCRQSVSAKNRQNPRAKPEPKTRRNLGKKPEPENMQRLGRTRERKLSRRIQQLVTRYTSCHCPHERKAHPPLGAGAEVSHGVKVLITGKHVNRTAPSGWMVRLVRDRLECEGCRW
jgi:hypothetical protein